MLNPADQLPVKPPGSFLLNLMQRSKLKWSWKIEPEQRTTIELADFMRQQTLEGHYKGIWLHIANEGKRSKVVGMILKAMGMIPGAPDFIFIWREDGGFQIGFIELKVLPNKQTPAQKDFQSWALFWGVRYALHYSAESAVYQLKEWGAV